MRAGLSESEVRAEDITHMVAVAAGMGREFRTLGLIGTGHFLSHLYQLALPPLFPLIMIDLDANLAGLGMAIGAYSVSTGILQTPVGFLVDRIGGRHTEPARVDSKNTDLSLQRPFITHFIRLCLKFVTCTGT